jgi:hypothetical protein
MLWCEITELTVLASYILTFNTCQQDNVIWHGQTLKPRTLFKIQISCTAGCPVMVVYVLNRMKFLAGHTKVNRLTFLVIINENIQPFFN